MSQQSCVQRQIIVLVNMLSAVLIHKYSYAKADVYLKRESRCCRTALRAYVDHERAPIRFCLRALDALNICATPPDAPSASSTAVSWISCTQVFQITYKGYSAVQLLSHSCVRLCPSQLGA